MTRLFQLDIPDAPGVLRYANAPQAVTFHGLTFLPFGVDVDALEDATTAALIHWRATFQNVSQEFQSLAENYWRSDPHWEVISWPIDLMQPDATEFGAGEVFGVEQIVTDLKDAVCDMVGEGFTLTTLVPHRRYTVSGGFPAIPRRN